MIRDALELVGELKAESLCPKTVHETRTQRYVKLGDDIVPYAKDLPARDHDVDILNDLIALANRFHEDDHQPVVWFNEDTVVLVVNDEGDRADVATMKLERSDLFKAISNLNPATWYQPKDFVRLLRITLYGALEPSVLLDPVRKVKFETTSSASSENARTRESVDKSILNSISSASALPEYVTLTLPVYVNPGANIKVSVVAAVEIDYTRQAFQLVILPDELENAKDTVMRHLADVLGAQLDDGVLAYQGSPS
jgi:hypothetical protein